MRIDMPTCQYGEGHCRKRFDENCLLKPDLLDERCPIRRTINDILEIVDEEDKNRRNELGVAYDSGSITVADRIRNRILALKGEQE